MDHLKTYYNKRLETLGSELSGVSQHLKILGVLRLSVFFLALLALYYFYNRPEILFPAIGVFAVIFVFLVLRFTRWKYLKDKLKALQKIVQTELLVLEHQYGSLPTGRAFEDADHTYSGDIELFGDGSFFQYANRTALPEGMGLLAKMLKENSTDQILEKQKAIKELSQIPEWRQEFTAIASLVKTEFPTTVLLKWLAKFKPILPKKFNLIPGIFAGLSIGLITLYILDLLSGWFLLSWFLLGLVITGSYLKKINKLNSDTSKILSTFQQYHRLFELLEKTKFESELLRAETRMFQDQEVLISSKIKEFSGILNAFDQRNNMLFGVFGNGFLLWDLWNCIRIQKWIGNYGSEVNQWFHVISFFDALNSLSNFAFNHPDFVFPTLVSGKTQLKVTNAVHPLIIPEKRVTNNLHLERGQFFIITGANMAGKSTFLRTVSLLLIMANTGLPVCASSMEYQPIRLITSMRTADSLSKEESYFFSELKRLKFIVEEISRGPYLIILDEILKGTNSTDKAVGSRKFIDKLVKSNSTGIIATHDLSLCQAAKELDAVENYYFDATIEDDELFFDYTLRPGICQNMNASFLLKKMKIIDQ